MVNGVWRYELTYNGQTTTTNFGIGTVLPVNLLSFAAEKQGQTVRLNWETENEKAGDKFEVERSRNGVDFTTIATVDVRNRPGRNAYAATDKLLSGKTHYRLKTVDKDATFRHSNVVIVNSAAGKIYVEPQSSVFTEQINLKLNGAGKAALRLVNASGQAMWANRSAVAGTLSLSTGNFASGVYLLLVSEGDEISQRIKLVKP